MDNQSLYFSKDYDLTQHLQNFIESRCQMNQPRSEFMYNEVWTKELQEIGASEWVTPFISGFVSIDFVEISNSQSIELCLITRRDKRRQGLRYLTRGANSSGNPANTC